jgi:pimeloyl-ACP methyl ester carboxylesterase
MKRILYLHGFASGPSSSKARYFRDRLERAGAHVEVPDLSAGDFEHLTLSGQLAIIECLANGEPVSLMGSSMGGYLAALYAASHPEVERVVLLAPAFRFAKRWAEHLGPAKVEAWRTSGSLQVFHYAQGGNRPLSYRIMEDAAAYEDFPDFRQPVLIFHGDRDEVVPAEYSRQFASTHPNVHLFRVLQSGHELLDVLDVMAEPIVQFLVPTEDRA